MAWGSSEWVGVPPDVLLDAPPICYTVCHPMWIRLGCIVLGWVAWGGLGWLGAVWRDHMAHTTSIAAVYGNVSS